MELERIIEGCKEGDPVKQRALYDLYGSRFYALSRRYAHDDEMAREIFNEGFVKVFDSIASYRGDGSFEGWMHTIFMRQAFKVYHRYNRSKELVRYPSEQDIEAFEHRPIEQNIDIRGAIIDAMRQLPEGDQGLVNMVAVEEYTFTEAAELMKVPLSTVKSRYYRSIRMLKKRLERLLGKDYLNK